MNKLIRIFFLMFFTIIIEGDIVAQAPLVTFDYKNDKQNNESEMVLEGTINRINALYSKDNDFLAAFKVSNELWMKYRDAQLKMRYPSNNPQLQYGSMYSKCYYIYLTELTKKRINELRLWSEGLKEGETCCGSVHFHN